MSCFTEKSRISEKNLEQRTNLETPGRTQRFSLATVRDLCGLGEVRLQCFDSVLHDAVVRKVGKCHPDETAVV